MNRPKFYFLFSIFYFLVIGGVLFLGFAGTVEAVVSAPAIPVGVVPIPPSTCGTAPLLISAGSCTTGGCPGNLYTVACQSFQGVAPGGTVCLDITGDSCGGDQTPLPVSAPSCSIGGPSSVSAGAAFDITLSATGSLNALCSQWKDDSVYDRVRLPDNSFLINAGTVSGGVCTASGLPNPLGGVLWGGVHKNSGDQPSLVTIYATGPGGTNTCTSPTTSVIAAPTLGSFSITSVEPQPSTATQCPNPTEVKVTWTASSNAVSYKVLHCINQGCVPGAEVGTVTAPTLSFIHTTASNSGYNNYQIRATDATGATKLSDNTKGVTPYTCAVTPSSFCNGNGTAYNDLKWSAPYGTTGAGTSISSFDVKYCTGSSSCTPSLVAVSGLGGTAIGYTHGYTGGEIAGGLPLSTLYRYQTTAYSSGIATPLNIAQVTTVSSCAAPPPPPPPAAECTLVITPSSATIAQGSSQQFSALYDPDGPSGSQAEQNVSSSATWWSDNIGVASHQGSGNFLGASAGSTGIHATYASCSGKQADATLNVNAVVTIPSPTITGLRCESNVSKATINWTNVASKSASGYWVDISTNSSFSPFWNKFISDPNTTSTTAPDGFNGLSTLTSGTTYYVRVYYIQSGEHSPTASFAAQTCQATQDITISGRVYNETTGAGFSGAAITTCRSSPATVTTDSNGNFSFTVPAKEGFCARVSPETRAGFNGPFLNNNAGFEWMRTYEWQVAGWHCASQGGCNSDQQTLDRASDTGYDFRYQAISTPSCDPNAVGSNQLIGCLWDGTNFTTADGSAPVGSTLSSPVPDSATALDYNWGGGSPDATAVGNDTYSAKWKGNFTFKAGTYTFTIGSDDGVRVKINGEQITSESDWVGRAYLEKTYQKIFSSQTNALVELEYFEDGGQSRVNARWTYAAPVGATQCNPPLWEGWKVDSCYDGSSGADCNRRQEAADWWCQNQCGQPQALSYQTAWIDGIGTKYIPTGRTCAGCSSHFSSITCGTPQGPNPLSGFCEASPNPINAEGSTIWTAFMSGGVAPYTYSWSGTDGLTGSGMSAGWTYPSSGTKQATVVVTDSIGSAITQPCASLVVTGDDGGGDGGGNGGGGDNGGGGGCNDECSSGVSQCTDATHIQTCGNFDSDSCLEWGPTPPNSCSQGEQCISGSCAALPPNPPESFAASAGPACNLLTFSWVDTNSPPADSFTISCNSGAITISGLTGNSHTFTGAEGNTAYTCAIEAVRSGLSSTQTPAFPPTTTTLKCPDFGLNYFGELAVTLSTAGSPKDTNTVTLEVTNAGTSFTGEVELSVPASTVTLSSASGAQATFSIVSHFGATTLAPGQTTTLYVTVSGAQPIATYNGFVNIKGVAPSLGTEHIIAVPLEVEVKSPGFQEI